MRAERVHSDDVRIVTNHDLIALNCVRTVSHVGMTMQRKYFPSYSC